MFSEECKYIKEEKVGKFIDDDLETYSGNSDEENPS